MMKYLKNKGKSDMSVLQPVPRTKNKAWSNYVLSHHIITIDRIK